MVCGHEVIEVAHGEQALGEGVGSAHVWLVCLVGWVASIVLARRQLGSGGGEYFSSLLKATNTLPLLQNYYDKCTFPIAYRQCLQVSAGWLAQTTKDPAFTGRPVWEANEDGVCG